MKIPLNISVLKRAKSQFIEDSLQHSPESKLKWYDSFYNPWDDNLIDNERAVVVDLGGSFVRIGVVASKNEQFDWIYPIKKQPAVLQHDGVGEFVDWLMGLISPLYHRYLCNRLGIIVSYPHTPFKYNQHITAVITAQTKGLNVPGLINTDIGKAILGRWHGPEPLNKLVTINDSVATVLSSKQSALGVIVATGGNICSLHPRLPHLRNVEAGNFNAFEHLQSSKLIDISEQPGTQTAEKQSTGRYLYRVLAHEIILRNLPAPAASQILELAQQHGSAIVDDLAQHKRQLLPDRSENRHFNYIIQGLASDLLYRSAQIWGTMAAACLELNRNHIQFPATICVTGGVALDSHNYLHNLHEVISSLTPLQFRIQPVSDPIEGAAVAVLSN